MSVNKPLADQVEKLKYITQKTGETSEEFTQRLLSWHEDLKKIEKEYDVKTEFEEVYQPMFDIDINDLPEKPLLVKDVAGKYYLVSYGEPLIGPDYNGMTVWYNHHGVDGALQVTFFEPEMEDVPVVIKGWSPSLPDFVTPARDFNDQIPCQMACIVAGESEWGDVKDVEGRHVELEIFGGEPGFIYEEE